MGRTEIGAQLLSTCVSTSLSECGLFGVCGNNLHLSQQNFIKVTYMIGRNPTQVDYVIDSSDYMKSAFISRNHARIVRQKENAHRLFDDSLNGVFVNNVKISGSIVLQEGDRVTFGHPVGSQLKDCARVRQPDSEYQFIFETCSCTISSESDSELSSSDEFSTSQPPVQNRNQNDSFRRPKTPPSQKKLTLQERYVQKETSSMKKRHERKPTESFSLEDLKKLSKSRSTHTMTKATCDTDPQDVSALSVLKTPTCSSNDSGERHDSSVSLEFKTVGTSPLRITDDDDEQLKPNESITPDNDINCDSTHVSVATSPLRSSIEDKGFVFETSCDGLREDSSNLKEDLGSNSIDKADMDTPKGQNFEHSSSVEQLVTRVNVLYDGAQYKQKNLELLSDKSVSEDDVVTHSVNIHKSQDLFENVVSIGCEHTDKLKSVPSIENEALNTNSIETTGPSTLGNNVKESAGLSEQVNESLGIHLSTKAVINKNLFVLEASNDLQNVSDVENTTDAFSDSKVASEKDVEVGNDEKIDSSVDNSGKNTGHDELSDSGEEPNHSNHVERKIDNGENAYFSEDNDVMNVGEAESAVSAFLDSEVANKGDTDVENKEIVKDSSNSKIPCSVDSSVKNTSQDELSGERNEINPTNLAEQRFDVDKNASSNEIISLSSDEVRNDENNENFNDSADTSLELKMSLSPGYENSICPKIFPQLDSEAVSDVDEPEQSVTHGIRSPDSEHFPGCSILGNVPKLDDKNQADSSEVIASSQTDEENNSDSEMGDAFIDMPLVKWRKSNSIEYCSDKENTSDVESCSDTEQSSSKEETSSVLDKGKSSSDVDDSFIPDVHKIDSDCENDKSQPKNQKSKIESESKDAFSFGNSIDHKVSPQKSDLYSVEEVIDLEKTKRKTTDKDVIIIDCDSSSVISISDSEMEIEEQEPDHVLCLQKSELDIKSETEVSNFSVTCKHEKTDFGDQNVCDNMEVSETPNDRINDNDNPFPDRCGMSETSEVRLKDSQDNDGVLASVESCSKHSDIKDSSSIASGSENLDREPVFECMRRKRSASIAEVMDEIPSRKKYCSDSLNTEDVDQFDIADGDSVPENSCVHNILQTNGVNRTDGGEGEENILPVSGKITSDVETGTSSNEVMCSGGLNGSESSPKTTDKPDVPCVQENKSSSDNQQKPESCDITTSDDKDNSGDNVQADNDVDSDVVPLVEFDEDTNNINNCRNRKNDDNGLELQSDDENNESNRIIGKEETGNKNNETLGNSSNKVAASRVNTSSLLQINEPVNEDDRLDEPASLEYQDTSESDDDDQNYPKQVPEDVDLDETPLIECEDMSESEVDVNEKVQGDVDLDETPLIECEDTGETEDSVDKNCPEQVQGDDLDDTSSIECQVNSISEYDNDQIIPNTFVENTFEKLKSDKGIVHCCNENDESMVDTNEQLESEQRTHADSEIAFESRDINHRENEEIVMGVDCTERNIEEDDEITEGGMVDEDDSDKTSSIDEDDVDEEEFDVEASLFEHEPDVTKDETRLSNSEEHSDSEVSNQSPSAHDEKVSTNDDDPTESIESDGERQAEESEGFESIECIEEISIVDKENSSPPPGDGTTCVNEADKQVSVSSNEPLQQVKECEDDFVSMPENDCPSSPLIEFQGNEYKTISFDSLPTLTTPKKRQSSKKEIKVLDELSCSFDEAEYSPVVIRMDSLDSDDENQNQEKEVESQEDIFSSDEETEQSELLQRGQIQEPSTSVVKTQPEMCGKVKQTDNEMENKNVFTDSSDIPSSKYQESVDSGESEVIFNTFVQPPLSKSTRKRAVDGGILMSPAKRMKIVEEISENETQNVEMDFRCDELTDTQLVNTPKLETKLKQKILESKSTSSKEKARMILERLKVKREKMLSVKKEPQSPSSNNNSQEMEADVRPLGAQRKILSSAADITLDNVNDYVGRCRDVINGVDKLFKSPAHLQHNPRVKAWIKELDEIRKRLDLPKTVIAVVGDTGAGKSSLMNAILDQVNVLPTSGMRACTAVVVEVTINTRNSQFEADIEFLSEKEWYDELELLLQELTGPDGKVRNRQPDPKSDAGVAYSKVRSVYGKADQFEVLKRMKNITKWLGKIRTITASNPTKFQQLIDRYIESTDTGTGGQYWPIVKHVRLRIPNCDVCSSGAILVDLPGVRDSNAARDKIAKEYLKNCTAVWVVSSIHRAIDDKTAKDLLGENFRRQLLMDGQYGSIAFICTKTDVLIPSEIIRSLEIEGQSKPLEDEIMRMEMEVMDANKNIRCLKKEIKSLEQETVTMAEEISEIRGDLSEALSLLEPDGADSENHDEQSQLEELKADLNKRELEIEEKKQQVSAKSKEKHALERKVLELDRQTQKKRKSLVALCAKARNEYSKTQIKKDFRAGLREMKRKAGLVREDEEEEDLYEPEDEEDSEEIGNYVDNLKVFCVSSTEYQKMKNLLTNDGPPQVFSSEEETQVPEIKAFVHEMTSVRKMQGTERLIRCLGRFLFDLDSYISDEGTSNHGTRKSAKYAFDVHVSRLKVKLEPILSNTLESIQEVFQSSLQPKLEEGVMHANEEAPAIGAKWSLPTNREDRKAGGLHFSTYKATIRRDGSYKSPTFGPVDFNEDLSAPVYSSITISWDRIFNGLLWKTLDGCKGCVLQALKFFVMELSVELNALSVQPDRIARVNTQFLISANNKLTDIITHIREFTSERQRDISRLLTPCVQSSMAGVYADCTTESGPGTFSRMKDRISSAIETKRFVMFDGASKHLLGEIEKLEKEIVEKMRVVCMALCEDLKAAFEPLWEAPTNTKILRDAFLTEVKVFTQITRKLFDDAKIKEDIEKPVIPTTTNPEVEQEVTAPFSELNKVPSDNTSLQSVMKPEPGSTQSPDENIPNRSIQTTNKATLLYTIQGGSLLQPQTTVKQTDINKAINVQAPACPNIVVVHPKTGEIRVETKWKVMPDSHRTPNPVAKSSPAPKIRLVNPTKIKTEFNAHSVTPINRQIQQSEMQDQRKVSSLEIHYTNRLRQINEEIKKVLNVKVMNVGKCLELMHELEKLPLSPSLLRCYPDIILTIKQCTKFKSSDVIKQKAKMLHEKFKSYFLPGEGAQTLNVHVVGNNNSLVKNTVYLLKPSKSAAVEQVFAKWDGEKFIPYKCNEENIPAVVPSTSKSYFTNQRSGSLSSNSSIIDDKPSEKSILSPAFRSNRSLSTTQSNATGVQMSAPVTSSATSLVSKNLLMSGNSSASPRKSRLSRTKRKLITDEQPSSDLPTLLSPSRIKIEPECEFSNMSARRKRRKLLELGTIDLTEDSD